MQQKLDEALDKKPLTIKLRKGQRDRVRSIVGWQDKFRDMVEKFIEGNNG